VTYVSPIKQQEKIVAGDLHAALRSGREIAVLDVRPHGDFLAGHIVRSVPLPLGRIEADVGRLVPRKSATIVVVSGSDAIAARAVGRLRELGYVDVATLDGGIVAWQAAGHQVITGQHALSKALGEFVEREYHTPRLTAEELQRRRDAGEKIVVVDTRPLEEFEYVAIPDSVAAPGAELLYRFDEIVSSPDTTVVVTCAGRTRGIIGAQALLNAGVTNPVYSLENGTSGWEFAGLEPWRGADRVAPAPRADALAQAKARAAEVERRFGIRRLDAAALQGFRSEAVSRTLYLYDVRTREEYLAGHLPGSLSAPGGQLVQTTDLFVATNNARIVVIDGADGARGAITASWLVQLGIGEVYVYRAQPEELTEQGEAEPLLPVLKHARYVNASDVSPLLAGGSLTVIDFASPLSGFQPRNVPKASWFATRESLPENAADLPGKGPVLLLSRDGVEAAWAANDIAADATRPVLVLRGGNRAWEDAGLPVVDAAHEHSLDSVASPNPVRSLAERKKFFADYVAWGDTIVAEIKADGTLDLGARS
jgi:rhodanese-related sulfurtransferase